MAHPCMKVSPRHDRRLIQHWEVAGSVEEQNWWGQLAITWEVWGYLGIVHRKWRRHLSIQVKKCVETSNNRSGGPTTLGQLEGLLFHSCLHWDTGPGARRVLLWVQQSLHSGSLLLHRPRTATLRTAQHEGSCYRRVLACCGRQGRWSPNKYQ